MNDSSRNPTADEAAAAWYARLNADDCAPDERRAFREWRDADPAHDSAWRAVEQAGAHADAAASDERIRAMVAEALHQPDRRTPRLRRIAVAAAAVLAVGAGSYASWRALAPARNASATTLAAQGYHTGVGERAQLTLADGTHVTLDAATELRVDQSGRARKVDLVRGQAYFQVTKDPSRPFVVSASGHSVTALGTSFDVDVGKDRFRVALVEGKVRVAAHDGASWILDPGNVLTARDGAVELQLNRAAVATGWIDHLITFDATPLAEVVEQMNRYSRRKIVLDPALRDTPFSGALRTDNGEALIAALEAYHIARVTRSDDQQVLLAPY